MRRYILAILFLLVPALAFGATATSTTSGAWSGAIWSGGSGSGGAPADGDAVTIAEGHSVLMDADLSGWTGITTLTITGSASGTPGMLYFKNGTNGYLKFATGGSSTYGIAGTNVTNKGRLLANANGDWDNSTELTFANKAIIDLGGTTTAAASATIYAQYLDIKLICHEPVNKSVTVYYDKYGVSSINTTSNVVTLASSHGWSANRAVKVRSTGTLPAPLTTADIYYVGSPSGTDLKLLTTSGGTEVDLTSAGSGTIEIYSGYETYSGVSQVNILEDVTADTGWTATDTHDAVVLADIGPANYDQQRTTIASIDSATQITLAAALDSTQYPGAKIWLSSRNISIRSASTSSSHNIITGSTSNTLGCEIKNTAGTGTTFYSYGFSSSNNNTISGTISGCSYGISSSSNNTISGTISGCGYGLYFSNNNTISGTVSGCSYGLNSSSNNTISGTISGCDYGLTSSSNNIISGTVSGCSNVISSSSNNTISGTISGCSYDVRGNSVANQMLLASDRSVLSFYPGVRNTSGNDMRIGLETPSVEKVYDAWGDIDRVTTGSGSRPNQRTGGNADVMEIYTRSGISTAQKLKLFDHHIYVPSAGSRTITYYAQTDYSGGLTSAQVALICDYADNATDNHRTTVQSTESLTARADADDWDQYLSVTVDPGQADSFVKCVGWLYKHLYEDTTVKYLWIDPKLVSSGLTISPRWYAGESLVESSSTVAGGGGKWVY